MPELRDSVIEFVDIDQLIQHPRNVNQGDVGAICESMQRNGTYGCVSVQVSTKHICRGNHTVLALQSLGYTEARVEWLDISDEEALRILIADNRIPELAHRDDQDVANLLSELAETEGGLTGTGYDGDDLDTLLADLATNQFKPEGENPRLDQLDPKWATCPECGHKWDQRDSS